MYQYFGINKEWRAMYSNWESWGGQLYDTIADCPNCCFIVDRSNLLVETLQLMAKYLGIDYSSTDLHTISTETETCP